MSPAARHRAARRERIIASLRQHFARNPPRGASRAVLFGSLARGDLDTAPDADLLVIGARRLGDGIRRSAVRDVDVVAWPHVAGRDAPAARHPSALEVEREGVELWHATG
ncbi:nucleotidyltransferase domain-containing protein [Roseomonas sp. CCTCC AB2023176]|uniref:nucleotidyltransferase domain-containing protein n=1 Tax=Roseomonas sp. CCTCC AB2023176 TaxID=3342640 RepID=UPI0035DFC5F2